MLGLLFPTTREYKARVQIRSMLPNIPGLYNNTTKGAPPLITSAALPHYLNLPSTWIINYYITAMANKAFISSNKSNTEKRLAQFHSGPSL